MGQLMVSLVVVVVALNVAVLLYARTATRRGEIAVRTALGASRGRIVAQLFIEALVLALAACAPRPCGRTVRGGDRQRDHGAGIGRGRTVLVGPRHPAVHDGLRSRARRGHCRDCRHPAGAPRDAATSRGGHSSARAEAQAFAWAGCGARSSSCRSRLPWPSCPRPSRLVSKRSAAVSRDQTIRSKSS